MRLVMFSAALAFVLLLSPGVGRYLTLYASIGPQIAQTQVTVAGYQARLNARIDEASK